MISMKLEANKRISCDTYVAGTYTITGKKRSWTPEERMESRTACRFYEQPIKRKPL
jgi:hypothetical protein